MPTQTVLHKSKAETTVNTFISEIIEVPNTSGARLVMLEKVLIDLDEPEGISATKTEVKALIAVGDCKAALDAAGAVQASIPGVCALLSARMYGVGSTQAATQMEFAPGRMVPPTVDGKRYVTVAVKGVGNTAVKSARFSAVFTVM